jgi:hypothetical protein
MGGADEAESERKFGSFGNASSVQLDASIYEYFQRHII